MGKKRTRKPEPAPTVTEQVPDSESDEDVDEEMQDAENLDVDFEFFDPCADDVDWIAAMLRNWVPGVNTDEVAKSVVDQTRVGIVVKADDNPFGFITALPVSLHREEQWMGDLRDFTISCVSRRSSTFAKKLRQIWTKCFADDLSCRMGVLVSERMIGCPHELSVPLHRGLFDEIGWATEDEKTEQMKNAYKFDCLLSISTVARPVAGGGDDDDGEETKPRWKHRSAQVDETMESTKVEDAIYQELSDFTVVVDIHSDDSTDESIRSSFGRLYRRCVCITLLDSSRMIEIREKLKHLLGDY